MAARAIMIDDSRFSRGKRSRPLFGVLPLARLLPQDAHSVIDYAGSLFIGLCSLFTAVPDARAAGLAAMTFGLIVSVGTDYRLSLVKLVPIEVHEVMDYLLGTSLIALPFLLGYSEAAPVVSFLQAGSGLGLIAMATVTDYRGFRAASQG